MNTLKEVNEFLTDIPYINQGGCGISALAIYRWLNKNNQLTNNTSFVYMHKHHDKEDYEINKSILKNNNHKTPKSCNHACLFHNDRYIDAKGEIASNRLDYEHFQFIKKESFILASINNVDQWSNLFERAYIGYIEDALKINLSDIKGN